MCLGIEMGWEISSSLQCSHRNSNCSFYLKALLPEVEGCPTPDLFQLVLERSQMTALGKVHIYLNKTSCLGVTKCNLKVLSIPPDRAFLLLCHQNWVPNHFHVAVLVDIFLINRKGEAVSKGHIFRFLNIPK